MKLIRTKPENQIVIVDQEEFDKISFVRTYEKYDWIIGSGVYLDEIEKELQRKKEIFNQTINNQVKSMIIIFHEA